MSTPTHLATTPHDMLTSMLAALPDDQISRRLICRPEDALWVDYHFRLALLAHNVRLLPTRYAQPGIVFITASDRPDEDYTDPLRPDFGPTAQAPDAPGGGEEGT